MCVAEKLISDSSKSNRSKGGRSFGGAEKLVGWRGGVGIRQLVRGRAGGLAYEFEAGGVTGDFSAKRIADLHCVGADVFDLRVRNDQSSAVTARNYDVIKEPMVNQTRAGGGHRKERVAAGQNGDALGLLRDGRHRLCSHFNTPTEKKVTARASIAVDGDLVFLSISDIEADLTGEAAARILIARLHDQISHDASTVGAEQCIKCAPARAKGRDPGDG